MFRLRSLTATAILMATVIAVRQATPILAAQRVKVYSVAKKGYITVEKVVKTDEEWKKLLTPEQFEITRKRGTERSCSGAFWNNHRAGVYRSCRSAGGDRGTRARRILHSCPHLLNSFRYTHTVP